MEDMKNKRKGVSFLPMGRRCFSIMCMLLVSLCISQLCSAGNNNLKANPPAPTLKLAHVALAVDTPSELLLDFVAGQRGFMSSITIYTPQGIHVSLTNTTVNVIGRGEVALRDLCKQSIGRTASSYSYNKVGDVELKQEKRRTAIIFKNIDLRPCNGIDLRLRFKDVKLPKVAAYQFEAEYIAAKNPLPKHQQGGAYVEGNGMTSKKGSVVLQGVRALSIAQKNSNRALLYSEEWDVKELGLQGDDRTDDTDALNAAIEKVNRLGGGTLYFPEGNYLIRTVHLLSNVWMHIGDKAVIKALPGADAPEETWFVDNSHDAGKSPTDTTPYDEPDNYLIKQDVGHSYFHNCMFFAERIENVKIWGTGRITGNGNIETGNGVMNNPPERRCDKMFVFKLCKNIELGGVSNGKDMWYDETTDEPCYLEKDGSKNSDISNMLHIDQGGHFVILATGTDSLNVHDIYCGKNSLKRARDIFDFMGCCDVTVTNIYSRVNGDDIIKLGSDCALGFTRPARNYYIRNIVGDTNCNVFQIGSETADDIQDIYVDNIYVLATNKAGFSISTNDGGHVRNVFLNSGKTGSIHSRSIMKHTRTPFFISISNRGRVLGASVSLFSFKENNDIRTELLVTNSNIGKVENIVIRGVDVEEVYAGSSYYNGIRWKPYDGSQPESTPIIAGFKLPDAANVIGGLNFSLPDGRNVGCVENIAFHDVCIKVKGGHPKADATLNPPEIGVGKFNVRDLKVQPSFGFWARHVKGLIIEDCQIETEIKDGRYPVLLHNVIGAQISNLKVKEGSSEQQDTVKSIDCKEINISSSESAQSISRQIYTIFCQKSLSD